MLRLHLLAAALALSYLLSANASWAESGTWLPNPANNDWNTAANWSSDTVPNGGSDTATFGASTITAISISVYTWIAEIQFNPGASSYSIASLPSNSDGFWLYGGGIENNSGVMQNFALAPDETGASSFFLFLEGAQVGSLVTFTCEGNPVAGAPVPTVAFQSGSSAGSGIFHNLGGTVNGGAGGATAFSDTGTTAAESTIISDGGTITGAGGGFVVFEHAKPDAGNATLVANGGSNGGAGGSIRFRDGATGGTARVELFGNGYFDMSGHTGPGLTIGSLEGEGSAYLGRATLTVGSNGLSTNFSGVLRPGTPTGGDGTGALEKIGDGALALSGANLYTAGTTVSDGALLVSNKTGSGTGLGPVQVNDGTLGGSGTIAGAVTVGTGGGAGAFLAPAGGTKKESTLTVTSGLIFNADATYTCTFKAKKNKARTDKVIANGVIINSGASFNFSGQAQGKLQQGLTLTLISNTSASPISGTFANLPDGAILTVSANNFRASYEGGDGNDLTLTVVP